MPTRRPGLPMVSRLDVAVALVALLCLPAAALAAQQADPSIVEVAESVFDGLPEDHGTRIVSDADRRVHYGLHISVYAGTPELRLYRVPWAASKDITGLLAADEIDEAFELLIGWMRLDMGARYVSDVGLDGINDEPVAVGTGQMRDRFHRDVFASHAEADAAYREWLDEILRLTQTD